MANTNWDEWLKNKEEDLKSKGYNKYVQNYKSEDFSFWKTFYNKEKKLFQVGVLFYDFRKYKHDDINANRISVMYECMLSGDSRVDLVVSKNITLEEFENMAKTFYLAMNQYV